MGPQPPLAVPDQLLGGEPARALHVAALDLAHVQRGVQRGAAVVEDVGPQDAVLAGQRVDDDLGHRRAVGEVEERPARAPGCGPIRGRAWRRTRSRRATRG